MTIMATNQEIKTRSPLVSEEDIYALIPREIEGRLFDEMAKTDPLLARELLSRAAIEGGNPELLVVTGAWIYSVLVHAIGRENNGSTIDAS